ncbi:MAG: HAMP domain-containing histidine kinase [Pirellulales bacterium]|nr:HAMP domain-containing histidine kinase [Pirellulales bacterium]
MDRKQKADEQLATLSSHLTSRRAAILQSWRTSVDGDMELTAPASLPRTQFNDHIPELLNAFEKRLRVWPRSESAASEQQRTEDAASHGLQRWQQGYRLREVTREWGHLHLCLVDELVSYSSAHPDLEPGVMPTAWRALAELCSQGVSESTTQYFELEKVEAAGHVRDMEQTLEEVRDLERRRTELFRQAAHDLRGNVGVVKNVTTGLTQDAVPATMRDDFLRLLERSVSSLNSMLDEVMDLARLQAGYELRTVRPFDAAVMLKELFDNLQPLAADRGLFLKADGADTLTVDGDAVKIRRIAQNLLLNALKYTSDGGVTLGWGDSRDNDSKRWILWVQDTGPGIHAGPGAPLVEALQGATTESRRVEEKLSDGKPDSTQSDRAEPVAARLDRPDSRPVHQARGEGIGLSIVKRLCELLDASIEVESIPDEGTTFRVVLPRHYNAAEQKL